MMACCSAPPLTCLFSSNSINNPPSPTASLPASKLLFSSTNKQWVSRRNRFYLAKPPEHDLIDTRQPSPQVSTQSAGDDDANPSTSFLSILCPLLRLFSVGDPSQERNHALEVATSSLSTLARFPWGSKSLSEGIESQDITISDPPIRLQLFEFEACPFCRRVREALTELDLSVELSCRFPFLIDPSAGISMYESGDIVKYLFKTYAKGGSPSTGLLESTLFTGWMPTILRAGRGMMLWDKARKDPPPRKLELFSYENDPYSRIVREALCELELPYILQNVGEGSRRTKLLLEASGSKQVPYIIDPNTNTQLGDYKKILSYLFNTYSSAATV
ncbi:uncharacterized protein LOC120217107 isoform X2 [Hibiscus syriacus]|uniref:uncharacterized protein LOC120217107 isoform X2 n=1 Tax=Hibiscus syriacus TaxID=106335 RepID=UPI001922076F|nr:uncharacterized protein LOC120217107 isoform X2 [Hibiscus syriacus]